MKDMNQMTQAFIQGGVRGVLFLISFLLVVLFAGSMMTKTASPSIAVRVLLPVWSVQTIASMHYVRSLAGTDERYAQCVTDSDACADTSLVGNLPILADVAAWFCIGGSLALLLRRTKKKD